MPGERLAPALGLLEELPYELLLRVLALMRGKSNVEFVKDLTRVSRVSTRMYQLVSVGMCSVWYDKCMQMRWSVESWARLHAESSDEPDCDRWPRPLGFLDEKDASAAAWFRAHSSHMSTRKRLRNLFAAIESRAACDFQLHNSSHVFSAWPPPPDLDQITATQEALGVQMPVELVEFHQCRLRFLDKFVVDEFFLLNIRRRQLSDVPRKILRTQSPELVLLQISEESGPNRALYMACRPLHGRPGRPCFASDVDALGLDADGLKSGAVYLADGWNVFFKAASFTAYLQSRLV
ncbi:hypothetical protein FVE85_3028 [Porphyridium purpureum]|uniref:F-box domain-containing protein n=1 Tax=Porphyridium purpureum TaxID=35688 RepID=A0A5J4YWG7_PORPP|nr:hypothetical protein FVE85_3028 [Porphyridium purpureum]|eukprot:POR0348..scf227_4